MRSKKGLTGAHCLVAANEVQCLNFWLSLLCLDSPEIKDDREEPEKQMQQKTSRTWTGGQRWWRDNSLEPAWQTCPTVLKPVFQPEYILNYLIEYIIYVWIYVLAALSTYPLWWWWHFRIWTQWVTFETLQTFDQVVSGQRERNTKRQKPTRKFNIVIFEQFCCNV